MKTLLESAKHFLNFTSNPNLFQNPMDVVYFSQAVENYLPYLLPESSNDVGHYMMDMVANILGKFFVLYFIQYLRFGGKVMQNFGSNFQVCLLN